MDKLVNESTVGALMEAVARVEGLGGTVHAMFYQARQAHGTILWSRYHRTLGDTEWVCHAVSYVGDLFGGFYTVEEDAAREQFRKRVGNLL